MVKKESLNSTSSLREKFLTYFETLNHRRVASSSLIPGNDPTILFTNAGMNQFKDVFLGLETRPYSRATTVQKCLRAGGKHNDLENVGFTARHHTFFEMLGNFSFGDYFKRDAVAFAWNFVTKVLAIPKDRLYVTVHLSDDETADIWHQDHGIPRDRIFRFDADNFWQMADVGPCGPCSEIFVDRQPELGKVDQTIMAAGTDRVMEIWNLVFMQFNQDSSGKRIPLPKPSVDTGMGLERLASVMQGTDSNYTTDSFLHLIDAIARETGIKPTNNVVPYRVIADHLRACSFLISDGVIPSNEGRGYVLRRILRRAIRFGRLLEQTKPFIGRLVPSLSEVMGDSYLELRTRQDTIQKIITIEEERFHETLEYGIKRLEEAFSQMRKRNQSVLDGELAFRLYDTYGFPLDLTQLICRENRFTVDEKSFHEKLELQKSTSRSAGKKGMASTTQLQEAARKSPDLMRLPHSFVGYEHLTSNSKVTWAFAFTPTGMEPAREISAGMSGVLIFDQTPFYPEGGGQVGDSGWLMNREGRAEIIDTQKVTNNHHGHFVKDLPFTIRVGDQAELKVDESKRNATAHNHSATHLLHSALRSVLGQHVKQSGSKVDSEGLRFDFSHFQATSQEELQKIENLANSWCQQKNRVFPKEMGYQEALEKGALALFDEKYGDNVRTISMGQVSMELCGGTHVQNTYECFPIRILSESSISAGVRRIEAKAGISAYRWLKDQKQELEILSSAFGSTPKSVAEKLKELRGRVNQLEETLQSFQKKGTDALLDDLHESIQKGSPFHKLIAEVNTLAPSQWRELADQLRAAHAPLLLLIYGVHDQKVYILCAATQNHAAMKTVHCGKIVSELAGLVDGKGGGRPDFAQAGGPSIDRKGEIPSTAKKLFESLK